MKVRIKYIDAFTQTPFTGNPAAVVVDASQLTEPQMRNIAREINLSETVFILPASKPNTHLRIRWFSPIVEVPLCGHGTVAAFHALAEENAMGMIDDGIYNFNVDSASGIIPVEVEKIKGNIKIMFGLIPSKLERVGQYKIDLIRVLNISLSDFDGKIPMMRNDYLFVAVKRLHTIFTMKPNFITMSYFLTSRNLRGMCVFTTETIDRDSKVHSRFFAPNEGINEDPVTGSAHGPITQILIENGYLPLEKGVYIFQAEQGDAIGRKGRLIVEVDNVSKSQPSIRVGGNAVTIMEAKMLINEETT